MRLPFLMIMLNSNDSLMNYNHASNNMQLYGHAIIMDTFDNISYREGNNNTSNTKHYFFLCLRNNHNCY